MNSGVYASYPRKRYGLGKALSRKYGGKRAPYRKRVNPVNQYTYRKTRIGKFTKTDMQSIKCTYTDVIQLQGGSRNYAFNSTAAAYCDFTDILQNSPEFASRLTQYSYYMINGMAVSLTRLWIDPIAYGVDGVSRGITAATYSNGFEMCSLNFYPNLKTTAVGQPVEDADSSWVVSPFIHGVQSHYQPFPKNFTTGTNSNGLGVWNACSQVANISGELAIYNSGSGAAASTSGFYAMFDVEINIYISFCNNTGI